MKMIAGVLLSLSLLLTGLPVPSQNPAWCNTESTTKEVKETGSETDVQQEEAGTTRKENVQGEEDGTSDAPEKKEQNINEKEAEKQEPPAYREEKAEEQKQSADQKTGVLKTTEIKAGQQEQKPEETMERTMEERQASPPTVTLVQDGNTKNLKFETEELKSLDPDDSPDGYHTEVSRKIICKHTAAAINASVKCSGSSLNPTENSLKGSIALTGKLRGKGYTAKVENFDAGGTRNTVSHLRLKVTVNAGGIKNQEIPLAYPYVCTDGYAGYSYIENQIGRAHV